ncbi:MAG: iron ABC transporter permease [Deltaproteobacteria bacterium]|nr:iron ABC transporter permease [Deltaproteobacteria bacterium]
MKISHALIILVCAAFLAAFLFYPLIYSLRAAFISGGDISFEPFGLLLQDPEFYHLLFNSINLAFLSTFLACLLALPLAVVMERVSLPRKKIFHIILLFPLILPPFVGAIGIRKLFARFGPINLSLMHSDIISEPINWLTESGLSGIAIVEALHLYPIVYLNLRASLRAADPALDEAAISVGAGKLRRFFRITVPMLAPGFFSGAVLAWIWAFTDLGTPLVFDYQQLLPARLFQIADEIHSNPLGFCIVIMMLLVIAAMLLLSKAAVGIELYRPLANSGRPAQQASLSPLLQGVVILLLSAASLIVILPHAAVILTSLADKWFITVIPEELGLEAYVSVVSHPLTASSIRNSLFLSSASAVLDFILGICLAWLITRRRRKWTGWLDAAAMAPLAVPGIIISFGYLGGFSNTSLDPRLSPFPLLIIGYAVRRLPFMVRSAAAGFQQASPQLEEAAYSVGASAVMTARRVTFPIMKAHLLTGAILCFCFAMLEVSESLILAVQEHHYPMTKAMYSLLSRPDGESTASALGVIGMLVLAAGMLAAARLTAKKEKMEP